VAAHRRDLTVGKDRGAIDAEPTEMESRMSVDAHDLAEQLLDAQVEFVLAELSGNRLAKVVARDVDDVLAVAGTMIVSDVVDAEHVKATVRRLVDRVGASPIVEDLLAALSDAVYDLAASEEYDLGDVIAREPVGALVAKLLSMDTLHERALQRMTESPLVAVVAARFVTIIIADFVQQNRARAERLPGMGSLLSMGTSAASKVRSATRLDDLLGDAAGKGTQYAVRRTNSAMRELLRDAPLHEAALELWDLHADEPISGLRDYVSKEELRELAQLLHEILLDARNKDYAGHLLDACIDVFFDRYGSHDVAALLPELGIERDDLVADIVRFAQPVIEAAKADGVLAAQIRRRLEPFYRSATVTAILGSTGGARKPRPTKKA
jgi:hypothetical protein